MPADIIFMVRATSLQGSGLRALKRELRSLATPGRRLVLDLTAIETIDSRAASVILETSDRLQSGGGSLELRGTQSGVLAFLELVGLDRVVETRSTPRLFLVPEAA